MKISKSLLRRSHYRAYFPLLRSRQQLRGSLTVPGATNQNLVLHSVVLSTVAYTQTARCAKYISPLLRAEKRDGITNGPA